MRRNAAIFGAALVAGAVSASAVREADAYYVRSDSAAACRVVQGMWSMEYNPLVLSSEAGAIDVHCLLADDTEFSKADAIMVQVGVNALGPTPVSAKLCVFFTTAVGAACGSEETTSGQGDLSLFLSSPAELSAWTSNDTAFGFVFVSLNSWNRVRGFATTF
jgi:hypothetical protein